MLRTVASSCRAHLSNTLTKAYPTIGVGCYRMNSSAVQDASDAAKAEARKKLEEVTSVIGKLKNFYHEPNYNSEEFIKKYCDFFNRKEIDSWEIRRAIQDFADFDCVPDPEISVTVLKACRRLNDFALAVRYMELLKDKCGNKVKEWYPYILQELGPTLQELGISTPEELGYDKPEFAVVDVDDIH
ncbi:cytochrome c oxidase subunit 5A, mitochondrial [Planococcus citri]|uniref:cytochrome c oxidase subunit 5A, mitochondrial n=1 Tax=Planococcus citri TaxID=170843 RepID=UPI0031F9E174